MGRHAQPPPTSYLCGQPTCAGIVHWTDYETPPMHVAGAWVRAACRRGHGKPSGTQAEARRACCGAMHVAPCMWLFYGVARAERPACGAPCWPPRPQAYQLLRRCAPFRPPRGDWSCPVQGCCCSADRGWQGTGGGARRARCVRGIHCVSRWECCGRCPAMVDVIPVRDILYDLCLRPTRGDTHRALLGSRSACCSRPVC